MKKITRVVYLLVSMLLAFTPKGFSQDPGDNPDGPPPAVPFDDYLLPLLIVGGVILAFFVIRRMQRKNVVK